MKTIFGFFGFYRNADNYSYNFNVKSYEKYIFTPRTINEDTNQLVDSSKLVGRFGDDAKISIYQYDKKKHIDKCNKVYTKKFINRWFQQGYRIFSFFYNISEISKLIKNDGYDPDDIIVLCRIDIGLNINDDILKIIEDYDIIVTNKGNKWVNDKVFVFRYKHIDVFINLYDDYELYVLKCVNNERDKPVSTRPEDIFFYHFTQYNLKIAESNSITIAFDHVCSIYCGHHRNKTKT